MRNLSAYTKAVRTVQVFIFSAPLGSRLLQGHSPFAFPPLGDNGATGLLLALVFIGLIAILPLALPPAENLRLWLWTSLAISIVAIVLYFAVEERFVVTVPTPNGPLTASVGRDRTPFALQTFPDKTDAEMLMERGAYETEVQKLWTEFSIVEVRLALLVFYVASLGGLNFAVGLFAEVISNSGKRKSNA